MIEHRVVITGMAVISPLGNSLQTFWENTKEGRSGIRPIHHFDTSGLPCKCAGCIKEFDITGTLGKVSKYLTKNTKIFTSSCQLALQDANYNIEDEAETCESPGMIIGSCFGNLEKVVYYAAKYEKFGYEGVTPVDAFDLGQNSAMNNAAIMLKARGVHNMISTGTASSLDAIGSAFHYIKSGKAKIVLTGGHENLFRDMFHIFAAKGLLAGAAGRTEEIIRPFDKNRYGLVLGEASAVMVLEDLEHARKRNARVYAEITGFGGSFADGKQKVSLKQRIKVATHSMLFALEDANLVSDDIDFINAAANGSLSLDTMEAGAVHRVFRSNKVPVSISSIKGAVGECYGASGAMQCISTVLAINDNIVPPTLNCINPITMIAPYIVMEQKKERPIKNAVVNAFDCSGFNSSLIVSQFKR